MEGERLSRPRYDWWPYEEWRPVDGFDGRYQVSDLGRVRSCAKTADWVLLRQIKKRTGYMCVNLYHGGKMKTMLVHRLVAHAFIGHPADMQVNHKDENKENNRLDNLEYVTPAENARHGTRTRRIVQNSNRVRAAQGLMKPVVCLSISGKTIQTYPSIREAARNLAINNGQISNCCIGNKSTAGGFMWRYANEQAALRVVELR
jgi:hypothetical protein